MTIKYKNENVIFYSRIHFSHIVATFRGGYSLVFCIKVFVGLDLVHSKDRNIETIRWSIKSPLLSQFSGGNVALWGQFYLAYNGSLGIWGWLWFSCGVAHSRRGLISVCQGFLLVLAKLSFWRGNWALGYHSM